jgi:hypothetical protein
VNLPEWDTLETVEAVHSFLEYWALGFFGGVVICDVLLQFLEGSNRFVWNVVCRERSVRVGLRKRTWIVKRPEFRDSVSLKRIIKWLSLIGFGLAILLEIFALPYSERIDELSKQGAENGQKQITASIQKSLELASENLKLEALIQPRDLSVEQQDTIAKSLYRYTGRFVLIWTYPSDAEGDRLAILIQETLKRSKIESSMALGFLPATGLPFQGIRINGKDRKFATDLENALKPYLQIAPPPGKIPSGVIPGGGMQMGVWTPPGHAPIAAQILIGVKPVSMVSKTK